MRINEFEEDVQLALEAIRNDGVILYPTDTIWGLGCGALNEVALQKIDTIKNRPNEKSYILLMTDVKQLAQYIANPLPNLQDILDTFIEPTTFIYPNAINLPSRLIASDGTVAVRITQDPFCRSLLKRIRQPLVSTSANKNGAPSPQNFFDIEKSIQEEVDYVVKWKQYSSGTKKSSSIYRLFNDGNYEKIR
jgi:L-threonylcarbamoyladenylate synthase